MARYRSQGEWREIARTEIDHPEEDGLAAVVVTEQADAHDTRTDTTYFGGAHRVRVTKCRIGTKPRGKTFIGETAWSQAEALHRSTVSTIQHNITKHYYGG